jgi:hypothetical protein
VAHSSADCCSRSPTGMLLLKRARVPAAVLPPCRPSPARRRTRWSPSVLCDICDRGRRGSRPSRAAARRRRSPAEPGHGLVDLDGAVVFPGLRGRPRPPRQGPHLGPRPEPQRHLCRGARDAGRDKENWTEDDLMRRAGFCAALRLGARDPGRAHPCRHLAALGRGPEPRGDGRAAGPGGGGSSCRPCRSPGSRTIPGRRRQGRRPGAPVRGVRARRLVSHDGRPPAPAGPAPRDRPRPGSASTSTWTRMATRPRRSCARLPRPCSATPSSCRSSAATAAAFRSRRPSGRARR